MLNAQITIFLIFSLLVAFLVYANKTPIEISTKVQGEIIPFGNIRKMSPWQRFKDQWRGRMRALSKGQPFDGVFDHSVEKYYNKVENVFIQSPK